MKNFLIIFLLNFVVAFFSSLFVNLKAQDFSIELKTTIDGKFAVIEEEEDTFDIGRGLELEVTTAVGSFESIEFFSGLNFSGNTVPTHIEGTLKVVSLVLKAEANFFSSLFENKGNSLFSKTKNGIIQI